MISTFSIISERPDGKVQKLDKFVPLIMCGASYSNDQQKHDVLTSYGIHVP